MDFHLWVLCSFVIISVFSHIEARQNKFSKTRHSKMRKYIIKCCGKYSCLGPSNKRASNSSMDRPTGVPGSTRHGNTNQRPDVKDETRAYDTNSSLISPESEVTVSGTESNSNVEFTSSEGPPVEQTGTESNGASSEADAVVVLTTQFELAVETTFSSLSSKDPATTKVDQPGVETTPSTQTSDRLSTDAIITTTLSPPTTTLTTTTTTLISSTLTSTVKTSTSTTTSSTPKPTFGNWDDNKKWCLQFGMTPLTFLTDQKINTLQAWASSWNYTTRFWTFGKKTSAKFAFCPAGEVTEVGWTKLNATLMTNGDCMAFNFTGRKGLYNLTLTTLDCSRKTFMACELSLFNVMPDNRTVVLKSEKTLNHKLQTFNLICRSGRNGNMAQGKRQKLFVQYGNGQANSARILSKLNFKFDLLKNQYASAIDACCKIGMQLLDLPFSYVYSSLVQFMGESLAQIRKDLFWTSGTDEGSEGFFGFANSKLILPTDAKWSTGQPDNKNGAENCLSVYIDGSGYGFRDENCNAKLRYICVAQDTSNVTTGGKLAQRECALNFGIDEDAIDELVANYTMSGVASPSLKCFIKCIGDLTNMITDGVLSDARFLRMIEAMAGPNEDELENNLKAFDLCANLGGSDECDRFASVHKCGAEKSPELVGNMVQVADVSTPIKLAPLPQSVAVCPEFDCPLDEKRMIDFKYNSMLVPFKYNYIQYHGAIIIGTNETQIACNKKYYVYPNPGELYLAAASICCSLGLKLVSLKSIADLACLNSLALVEGSTYWIGVSRLNKTDAPRNCFSGAPFNESLFPNWYLRTNTPDLWSLVGKYDNRELRLGYHKSKARPLCEE